MTIIQKHFAVRLLALLLAVVMLGGLFIVGAQAANASNVKQYNHYVCIGDSIAAGYGSYARDVRGFEVVPAAYHSHVANATGATVASLAHTGMRTVEVRWLLDDTYSASQEAKDLPIRTASITSVPTRARRSSPTARTAPSASSTTSARISRTPICAPWPSV